LVLHRIFLALKSGRENGPPSKWFMKEEEIFRQAPARSRSGGRAAYLERACAGGPALRAAVEALPRANVGASGLLDRPAPVPVATAEQRPANERASAVIGLDRLLEQIGGGLVGIDG
jgi:hypothetical protein